MSEKPKESAPAAPPLHVGVATIESMLPGWAEVAVEDARAKGGVEILAGFVSIVAQHSPRPFVRVALFGVPARALRRKLIPLERVIEIEAAPEDRCRRDTANKLASALLDAWPSEPEV
jgi:hypothetical protein